jgi:hypothetical protein
VGGYVANRHIIHAFLPLCAEPGESNRDVKSKAMAIR